MFSVEFEHVGEPLGLRNSLLLVSPFINKDKTDISTMFVLGLEEGFWVMSKEREINENKNYRKFIEDRA